MRMHACLGLAACLAAGAPGMAAENNILSNPSFLGDGIGGALGWDQTYGADNVLTLQPGAGHQGANALKLDFKTMEYFKQGSLALAESEPYEFGVWARTANLKTKIVVATWNVGWVKEQDSAPFPSDTKGEWVKVAMTVRMFGSRNGMYTYSISGKMNPGAEVEISCPFVRPLSEKAASGARSCPLPKALASRIVPIDPLLAKVSSLTGKLTFYYAGELPKAPQDCEFAATLDGKKWASGPMDARRTGSLAFGRLAPGRRRLTVGVRARGTSAFVKTNSYPITVIEPLDGPRGKRLNNFVSELARTRDFTKPLRFFCPREGWVYIGFTERQPGATVRFMNQQAPLIRPRESRRTETMRYLGGGWKTLEIVGASAGGELVVRAVPRIVSTHPSTDGTPSDVAGWEWRSDFTERYLLDFCNTCSWYGRRRGTEKLDLENSYYQERGMKLEAMVTLPCADPDRNDPDRCRARLGGSDCFRDGFDIAVDESGVNGAPRVAKVNFAEAVWDLVESPNAVNTFYCDAFAELFTDRQTQISEVSAIVNSGRGTGMLYPEVYPSAVADPVYAHHWEDHFVKFRASVTNAVPAAARNILYYFGTWLEPTSWTDWSCPEADIRVLYSDFIRRIATDPEYGDVGGIAAGFFNYTDDDVVRWLAKAVRHYAVEGQTNDLAAACGFRYLPGHVVNPDFADRFNGWTAQPAEEGSLVPHTVPGYGRSGQCRQHVENGVGDGVALFTRSRKAPNFLSQRVTGLKPGKVYCLEFVTADLDDFKRPWSVSEEFGVRATVSDGGEEIPEFRYSHKAPRNRAYHKSRGVMIPLKVLHRVVFTATKPDATLAFSDWAGEASPGAPAGRRTMLNWINLRQYYLESDEELEWLKDVARRSQHFTPCATL